MIHAILEQYVQCTICLGLGDSTQRCSTKYCTRTHMTTSSKWLCWDSHLSLLQIYDSRIRYNISGNEWEESLHPLGEYRRGVTLRASVCKRHSSSGSGRTQGDAPTIFP